MIGRVDEFGRALVPIKLKNSTLPAVELDGWIDTGFVGELVLPRELIQSMNLVRSTMVLASLADGTETLLESFTCLIDWLGAEKKVEVIASSGRLPLIGVGLLQAHQLIVDYPRKAISLI